MVDFSSEHIFSCGVPQSSVLDPLLFIIYTTHYSRLLSLNHHVIIYSIFVSYSHLVTLTQASPTPRPLYNRFPPGCPQPFLLLTLLRLNFLLLVSNSNFLKDNSSLALDNTCLACNLGFIFDEHLTFSDQISSLSKSCYSHI